jgi:hypothetical protein
MRFSQRWLWTCYLKGLIHDQSCCAKLFCATQVCPFTIKSISTIHDQSCCTTLNVAQHDWLCMGPFTECKAVYSVESQPTFRRNIWPPSSGSKNKPSTKQAWAELCFPRPFTLVSSSAYSLTLKMEAIFCSETSVDSKRLLGFIS